MDFLADYWEYHRCYEIPRNYAWWSGISLIQGIMHRKVYFCIADLEVHATDYIILVGPQGNKKITCVDRAKVLFQEACPDLHIGASTQSAEDIVKNMAGKGFERAFHNELGDSIEVRPYYFFINEFKNFIAYNPLRMVNFLGDIYDRKFFDSSTIARGVENIVNPSVNILACENPDQLIRFMKNDIMTGGFARRIIIVHEPDYAPPIAIPVINPLARAAWERIKQRLVDTRKTVGQYKFDLKGAGLFTTWYNEKHKSLPNIDNPLIKGYVSTKDTHLLKACMCLDCVSDKPMLLFTPELLDIGIALLDSIDKNMPKIAMSAGRNETMAGQRKILDVLEAVGGMLPEKILKRKVENDFKTPTEIFQVMRHLEDSGQIVKKNFSVPNGVGTPVTRSMVLLEVKYNEMKKKGEIKD